MLCSGGDLYVRDPYTELEAAEIVTDVLSAVAYLHSKGIIHRDLKLYVHAVMYDSGALARFANASSPFNSVKT
jgi:serine/threonine protein kinase